MLCDYRPVHRPVRVSLQNIADELEERLWDYTIRTDEDSPGFCGFRVYAPGEKLCPEFLYVLPEGGGDFPGDRFAFVCAGEREGLAEHICVAGRDFISVLRVLTEVFQRFQDLEADLNWIVSHGGDLNDLCRVAAAFLQNPVYIHNNTFAVLAQSCRVEGMLELDYEEKTGKNFIPLWLIEDFKFSGDYEQTLHQRRAAIWGTDQYPYHIRSLYVNIWDAGYYRGRLLVNELHAPLRPGDGWVAEYVAEYVRMILRRDDMNADNEYRKYEDTFKLLLSGTAVESTELRVLLTTLGWNEDDPYLIAILQGQDFKNAVTSENVLLSRLSASFGGSFPMLYERRLWMIVNLRAAEVDPAAFRSKLAPFLRDSFMYAGVSPAVDRLQELPVAAAQASYALERAFRVGGYQWCVPFEDYALEYLFSHLKTPLPLESQLAPGLKVLKRHDREHGSQLYATLRCYLRHERSIPRTAAALIIHRTTLLYRLEKIAALTKLDLDNEDTRLYLLISFWLAGPD